jgi:hypothetical protein
VAGIFVAQELFMKKIFLASFYCCLYLLSAAQQTKDWKKETLERAGDHFMISLTADRWGGAPDSISSRIRSTSRGLSIAFMLDKPFKTNPHWSVAGGLGISGSSIFLKKMSADIKSTGGTLIFKNLDSADHFKKYKLVTVFAEIPLELRYVFTPEKTTSWKAALGLKIGTLINAHTKGKTLQNSSDNTINAYTLKESKKTFFNGTRFAATARIGYGNFSLTGAYQLNTLIKDGAGPQVRPYQIGLCISGL